MILWRQENNQHKNERIFLSKMILNRNISIYIIKNRPQNIRENFLMPFDIVDYDYNASVEYGKIRASLEKKGIIIGNMDM